MDVEIRFASTEEERDAVYRLRYATYVEEMHLYNSQADHTRRWLKDADDSATHLMYARVGEEVVGTLRVHLGGESAISGPLATRFALERFLPLLTAQ